METSPGWPRHDLSEIKNLINHVRTTNNRNIATLEKEIVKLASSTTMQTFIQTIIFILFIYIWIILPSSQPLIMVV